MVTTPGLEILDEGECTRLLARASFGRVGVKLADDLFIAPVFYAFGGDSIVFRTAAGTKLDAAVLHTMVTFEVDDAGEGWSVVVRGHAEEVRNPSDAAQTRDLLGDEWPPGERDHLVRIRLERTTGRRLRRS